MKKINKTRQKGGNRSLL